MALYSEFERLRRDEKNSFTTGLLSNQEYKCALCGDWLTFQQRDSQTMPVVDHDHESGRIRGVVHGSCNRDLAAFENRPDWWHVKALEYLQRHGSRTPTLLTGSRTLEPLNRVELAVGILSSKTQDPPPITEAEIATAYRLLLDAMKWVNQPFEPWDLKQRVLLGPVNTSLDFAFDRIRKEGRVKPDYKGGYVTSAEIVSSP
ncbi:MAG: endonuclease VII domain-containing protein [Thermoplasmatales archaeon]|nr:endonuclease VII domain-containing protein [Thermoplasmatales archaeon]